jgi:hypothetical protein
VRGCIAVSLLLAGCDGLFGLERTYVDAAPDTCRLVDDFNGAVVGPMWANDPGPGTVKIMPKSGELVMAPRASTEGYDGIHTVMPVDLTGTIVHIDAKRALNPGPGEIHLVAKPTSATGTDNYYMIFTSDGYIGFRAKRGTQDEMGAPYSASADRYWRMRFEASGATIAFETSSDDVVWSLRRQIPITVPIQSLHIGLAAGAYNGGIADPGEGHFDDFSVCPIP